MAEKLPDDLGIGSVIELDDLWTRRKLMKVVTSVGAGAAGLTAGIENVAGDKPDGKPLVLTYDGRGNPAMIKILPEERHRRITLASALSTSDFGISGENVKFSTEQLSDDPNDIGILVELGKEHQHQADNIPESIQDVPVRHEITEMGGGNFPDM